MISSTFPANGFGLCHHLGDIWQQERFTKATKENIRTGGQLLQALDHPLPGRRGHIALRLVPGIADAGPAGQVAAAGRFHVHLGQLRDRALQVQAFWAFLQEDLSAGLNPIMFRHFRRQDQPALFIYFYPVFVIWLT